LERLAERRLSVAVENLRPVLKLPCMKRLLPACGLAICLILSGCAHERFYVQHVTSDPPPEPAVDARGAPLTQVELTPDGRWLKRIDIRTEPQGARIMVAGNYMGETPMLVEIAATPSGRFRRTTRIRLIPTEAGGRVHTVTYRAGEPIPSRLSFQAMAVYRPPLSP
jgi:hypothetical protein